VTVWVCELKSVLFWETGQAIWLLVVLSLTPHRTCCIHK